MKYLAILVLLLAPAMAQENKDQYNLDALYNTKASTANPASVIKTNDVMWWFDEVPATNARLIKVVITARAYDGVLDLLRQARGSNTKVASGESILDSNYHPRTYRFGEWIASQDGPARIPSLLYWYGEQLGDTTPVMDFYVTPRAYEQTVSIVSQYIKGTDSTVSANYSVAPKKSGVRKFLEAFGVIAGAALQGAAVSYAYQDAVNQQYAANTQASYAQSQQTYQLQQINQNLDQLRQQQVMNQINKDYDQYYRLLERMKTGQWAH